MRPNPPSHRGRDLPVLAARRVPARRAPAALTVLPALAVLPVLTALLLTGLFGCTREKAKDFAIPPEEAKVGRLGTWAPIAPSNPPLNLILLTLDTTRQSRLSCYGFPGRTTPHLDSLASQGILFENAVTPAPVTLTAHSTIMTGLYPYQHGVRNNGTYVLPDRFTTLAEILKAKGYDTGAVLGGFPLDHRFGLNQGFDFYEDKFPLTSVRRESDTAQRPAADVTRLALSWLDGRQGRPFFLWVHYFDPHFPYTPPEPYASSFASDPYSGEVSYMDSAIGDLMAGLRARGLLDRSAVMIVGDHGESLGDHAEATHSIFIYRSTLSIPFILRLPNEGPFAGAGWRGRRVADAVSLIDCLPTALNLVGLSNDERPPAAGESLVPLIEGKGTGHRWLYFESLVPQLEYSWSDLRGLQVGHWMYIRAPKKELYDLAKDPKEQNNLVERKTALSDAMNASLLGVLKQDIGGETGQVPMDQETIEKLRSLGYVAGAITHKPVGPAKDPKDMIRTYEQINAARTMVALHRIPNALALVDSVLAQNPDDGTARRIRGSCLVRMGRGTEAMQCYDSLLAACDQCPDELDLRKGRAMAALAAQQYDDAASRTRSLIAANPKSPDLHLLLGQILAAKGDLAGARKEIEEETRVSPDNPAVYVSLGDLLSSARQAGPAEAAYRKALELNAKDADALAGLAELMIATDRAQFARGYVEQALAADPQHPGALFRKAWFLHKEGRKDDALYNYLQALAQQPDNPVILYNIANIYMESNNMPQARIFYERAVQTGRPSQLALVNLGVLYARLGKVADAIEQWEKAIALDPKSAQVPSIRRNIEMAKAQMGGATTQPH